MKTCLVLLLAVLPFVVRGVEPLAPLSESAGRIVSSPQTLDISEFAYVSVRCAALYNMLAGYLEQGARDGKDREMAQGLNHQADVCTRVGTTLSKKAGKSDEELLAQFKALLEYYGEEMRTNKRLNNNAITPLIQADIEAAKTVFPLIQAMDEVIQSKRAKNPMPTE